MTLRPGQDLRLNLPDDSWRYHCQLSKLRFYKYLGTYLALTLDGHETHHLYVLYYVTYFYLLSMISLFIKYLYRMEHRPYLPVNTYIRYLPYVNKRNGSSHTYNHCVIARMQLSHTYVPYLRIGARLRPIEKWKHISGYLPG